MPPKKEVKEKILLGRPSNNLKAGIVGLPNVGKSTFFNVLTKSAVAAENYPFCTIDPSEARVAVPDERFTWLCNTYQPASRIPAFLTVMDIAGLVKGAHEGQGLGNAFLSHVRAVDAIFHMIRSFENEEIVHVEGEVDPVRDLEIIHEELRLKDEEFLKDRKDDYERRGALRGGLTKEKKLEYDVICVLYDWVVTQKKDVRFGDWNPGQIDIINSFQLLTAKPVLYLINLTQADYIRKKNKWLVKIKQWIDEREKDQPVQSPLIPWSGELESKVAERPEEEREAYLKSLETTSAMPKIIVQGYKTLQLIYFFTAGEDEVRAWTIRVGTKAPQAAGVIHTDFERGFIMAEVMHYPDLFELATENAVKGAGKYLQKGKEYVVEDGDVIFYKFNVTAPAKKK